MQDAGRARERVGERALLGTQTGTTGLLDLEDRGSPWDIRAVLRLSPGSLGKVPFHIDLKIRLD